MNLASPKSEIRTKKSSLERLENPSSFDTHLSYRAQKLKTRQNNQ